jgi:hypothetical protein
VLVHDRSAAEANVLNRRTLVVDQMRVFIDGVIVSNGAFVDLSCGTSYSLVKRKEWIWVMFTGYGRWCLTAAPTTTLQSTSSPYSTENHPECQLIFDPFTTPSEHGFTASWDS